MGKFYVLRLGSLHFRGVSRLGLSVNHFMFRARWKPPCVSGSRILELHLVILLFVGPCLLFVCVVYQYSHWLVETSLVTNETHV